VPRPVLCFEEPVYTKHGRVFSLDASFGLLATASGSALALFLGSALSFCGLRCMICEINRKTFWSSGHELAPLASERFFRPALSFCGVSCMLSRIHKKQKKQSSG